MKILALETSAKAVSAAVTENGRVLASGYQDTGLTHSRTLMPIVEHIMKNAEITMAEISAVAVAVGPGSFTGIRIGVSAAKGLAFAASIPAVGVSTLAAMARNAAFADGLVVCAMDARRNQIYNALFEAKNGALTRLTPDRAIGLDELSEELRGDSRPKIVVGDGGRLCAEALAAADVACRLAPPHLVMQHAVSVALEAEEAARKGGLVSAQELLPVYLRPPQAERLRKERESSEKSGQ
jgi:tRNA threonylcarbamoyladenosine biosynthesis protein TsaB